MVISLGCQARQHSITVNFLDTSLMVSRCLDSWEKGRTIQSCQQVINDMNHQTIVILQPWENCLLACLGKLAACCCCRYYQVSVKFSRQYDTIVKGIMRNIWAGNISLEFLIGFRLQNVKVLFIYGQECPELGWLVRWGQVWWYVLGFTWV